jgi:hypothetical protein
MLKIKHLQRAIDGHDLTERSRATQPERRPMNETQLLREAMQKIARDCDTGEHTEIAEQALSHLTAAELPQALPPMADYISSAATTDEIQAWGWACYRAGEARQQPQAPEQGAGEVVPREWRAALHKLAFATTNNPNDEFLTQAQKEAGALLSKPFRHTTPPAPKLEPMTDEQIEPMFRHRHAVPTVGEKDAWYWYAWGVSDGEAHHGISAKGAAE